MKRLKILPILLLFLTLGGFLRAEFQVGDTVTFKYYDPGFFAGFYNAKYMCRAVTNHAYIFTQEDYLKLGKIYSGNGNLIVFDPNKMYYRKLTEDNLDAGFSVFGYSTDSTSVIYGLKHTGKAALKKLTTGGIHFYTVTSKGLYLYNVSSWSERLTRKDLVDVAVSPQVPTALIRYMPYVIARYSMFTTLRNPLGRIIKLPSDLYIDEGFEPDFKEDTLLTEWNTSGNVNVVRTILSGVGHYVIRLNGNSSASKDFALQASQFKFKLTPILSRDTGEVYIRFLDSSDNPTFYLKIRGDSLFVQETGVGELALYSIQKVTGFADLNENYLRVCLNDSVVFEDTSFTFAGGPVNSLSLVVNTGEVYFDDIGVMPEITTVTGHYSNKDAFYVGAMDGLYYYNRGSWTKLYDGEVERIKPVSNDVIYILSGNLILKTNDGGASWDTLPPHGLDLVTDFDVSPSNSDFVVISGAPHGLMEFDGSGWVDISSSLLTWGPAEYFDTVYSVAFFNDTTIFVTTGQGVLKSADSLENLVEFNKGILRSFLTDAQVTDIGTIVDSAYTTMNDFFDSLAVDVDNDPRIVVLVGELSSLLTSGERQLIPILSVMNPELNYIPTNRHPNGNGHEMIEVDSYDDRDNVYFDRSNVRWRNAIYRSMAKLFFWSHDPYEAEWMVEGFAGIGEYLANYTLGEADTNEYLIKAGYSLKKIEHTPPKVEVYYESLYRPYVFLMHLWQKFGLDVLRNIFLSQDIPQSVVGLERISLLTGVSQNDLYADFILDLLKNENLDLVPNAREKVSEISFPPAYSVKQTVSNWSYGAFTFQIPSDDTVTLRLNGIAMDDHSIFRVVYRVTNDTVIHELTQFDEHGDILIPDLATVGGQDTTQYDVFVILGDSTLDDNYAGHFAASRDTTPPEISVGYLQNSIADQNVNLYVFSNEFIYEEVYDTTVTVYVTYPGGSSSFDLSMFDENLKIYSGQYTFRNAGKVYFEARMEDLAGNGVEYRDSVLAWYLGGGKLLFTGFSGEISLSISDGAVPRGGFAVYAINDGRAYNVDSKVYVFPNVDLRVPAYLTIKNIETPRENLGVYLWYDNAWHYIGGVVNVAERTISVRTDKLGPVTVMEFNGVRLPEKFEVSVVSNLIARDKLQFTIGVPVDSKISAELFDISGRKVMQIFDRNVKAGTHGFSAKVSRPGVYFLVVKNYNTGEVRKVRLVVLQ